MYKEGQCLQTPRSAKAIQAASLGSWWISDRCVPLADNEHVWKRHAQMQRVIIHVVIWETVMVKLISASEIFHSKWTMKVFALFAHHLYKNKTNAQVEAHPAPITQLRCNQSQSRACRDEMMNQSRQPADTFPGSAMFRLTMSFLSADINPIGKQQHHPTPTTPSIISFIQIHHYHKHLKKNTTPQHFNLFQMKNDWCKMCSSLFSWKINNWPR